MSVDLKHFVCWKKIEGVYYLVVRCAKWRNRQPTLEAENVLCYTLLVDINISSTVVHLILTFQSLRTKINRSKTLLQFRLERSGSLWIHSSCWKCVSETQLKTCQLKLHSCCQVRFPKKIQLRFVLRGWRQIASPNQLSSCQTSTLFGLPYIIFSPDPAYVICWSICITFW